MLLTHWRDIRRDFRCQRWKMRAPSSLTYGSGTWQQGYFGKPCNTVRSECIIILGARNAAEACGELSKLTFARLLELFLMQKRWDANVESMHGICNVASLRVCIRRVQLSHLIASYLGTCYNALNIGYKNDNIKNIIMRLNVFHKYLWIYCFIVSKSEQTNS